MFVFYGGGLKCYGCSVKAFASILKAAISQHQSQQKQYYSSYKYTIIYNYESKGRGFESRRAHQGPVAESHSTKIMHKKSALKRCLKADF